MTENYQEMLQAARHNIQISFGNMQRQGIYQVIDTIIGLQGRRLRLLLRLRLRSAAQRVQTSYAAWLTTLSKSVKHFKIITGPRYSNKL